MANANGWGDGASNNNIGWGKGADNAIGWGDIHADSWAGLTDIVGAPSTDPDAQAFITAASITDPTQQSAINTLVTDLKGYNIWTKFKAIYPIVGGTASTHKWNLKDPRDLDAAFRLTFTNSWTHSSTGMTPDGTSAFANTFLVPSTNLSLDSVHISGYLRTNLTFAGPIISTEDAVTYNNGLYIWPRQSANLYSVRINDNGFTGVAAAPADIRGLHIATRTASNVKKYRLNNTGIFNTTETSTGLNTSSIYLGKSRNNANYNGNQLAFASIGDGLSDTEAAQFATTVEKYQTTLGRSMNPWYDNGTLLLDTYQNSSAAYSLRKLRNFYIGAAIRVRRSSDNAEQDIYFNSTGNLDTASLLTFCGAGNGFVTTWYDQSGNTKDATQSTAINQPRIVSAGNLDLVNGKVAVLGDGVNDTLRNTTLSLSNPSSIFTVVDKIGTSGNFGLYSSGAGLGGAFTLTTTGYTFYQNGASFSPAYVNNNQSLLVAKTATTGTDWEFYGNNTTVINGGQNIGTLVGTVISLFDRSSNVSRVNMYMQEYIVWNSDQMTNRIGIQTEINTYYTIY